jgi:hypothetical protein
MKVPFGVDPDLSLALPKTVVAKELVFCLRLFHLADCHVQDGPQHDFVTRTAGVAWPYHFHACTPC